MEDAEIQAFGEALAIFRTRAGLSQQKLANELSMSRRSIAAWEGGENLPKTKGVVLQLARILKLTDEETPTLLKTAGIDPSLAIWNIPYPRNPFFAGRDQELERLHTQLQQENTAIVGQMQSISGLGGIGKTQLAVEYAYRYQEEYHYVLWARAENVEALISSANELAHRLNLPEKDAQEQELTLQAVKRWLQRQRGWLMILDNADSPSLLPAFLPSTVGGHLLITTRAADLSAQIAGLAHPLIVETFSDEQGALFLLHRSNQLALDTVLGQAKTHAQQLAMGISHELGGLPLALDQAGAYLKTTGSSLAAYQHIYQQCRAQLLAERRGAEHPEPVAITWNISFYNVEQDSPAAADLLRLCAFFAPDAIPEEILIQGVEELSLVLAPAVANLYQFNATIEALRAYSLLTRDPQAQTLSIHRLVQAVLRDRLSIEAQQQWIQLAVHAVATAYPNSLDLANWPTFERLLPHAFTCAIWIEQVSLATPEASHLLNQTGAYLHARKQYVEPERFFKQALAIREQQLGIDDPDTIHSLISLAWLYKDQGKYAEAERLLQRGLAICEQQLGTDHPSTATCLNDLGWLYFEQGKVTEAERLLQRVLAIREQLGTDSQDTVTSLNLARVYTSQGKYVEAEPLLQRALAIREQQLGIDHPTTAIYLRSLAELYTHQGKYVEAEPLLQHALATCEQRLGTDDPDTAICLDSLVALYIHQGKYSEAEPLVQRALAIREQRLVKDHPYTVTSLNELGWLYTHQGKYAEAEPLLQRALAIREQQLGAQHLSTASSLNNLALLYKSQGKYAEAKPLLKGALTIYEQQLGAGHPTTQTIQANYIVLLEAMKSEGEADS